MLKKPSTSASVAKEARPQVTEEQAEALADLLADKPYGSTKPKPTEDAKQKAAEEAKLKAKPKTLSISLPVGMIELLEDAAHANKRTDSGPKTVSGLIKQALEAAGFKS